ncbi:MAG: hypothetical protein E7L01_30960, partial [Paenibacillus macerans]|uniref:hypothetical protein n=1 Tax=Paenibacillus macerans TaxID=44252 RepID=UPI00290C3394
MQFGGGWPKTVKIQLDLKIRVDSWLLERQSVGIQNSGTLCTSVARTLTSIFSKTHIWIIETINGFF